MQTLAAGQHSAALSILAALPENLDELLERQMSEEDRRTTVSAHREERLFINDEPHSPNETRSLSSKSRRPGLLTSLLYGEEVPMIFDINAITDAQKQTVFRIDDCPNEMPWERSGLQRLCDHLQIVRELLLQEPKLFADKDGKVTSKSVTSYVKRHCGQLHRNLIEALGVVDFDLSGSTPRLIPEQIKWDIGDQLTAYGFPVGYDKANDVLSVNVGQWSILL